jgi:superkiller protein 3
MVRYSKDVKAFIESGDDLFRCGEFWGAKECYEQAVKADLGCAVAYYKLGQAIFRAYHDKIGPPWEWSAMGDRSDEEIQCYQKALELDPKYFEVLDVLGGISRINRDFAKAKEYYAKAIEVKSSDGTTWRRLADVCRELKEPDNAIKYYQKAIELNADDAKAYEGLAETYSDQGNAAKAIDYFQKAVQIDPVNPRAYYNLGGAYLAQHDNDNGVKCRQKSLYIFMVNSYIGKGDLLNARRQIDMFREIGDDNLAAEVEKMIKSQDAL